MKNSEILIKAKSIIENPDNWIKGEYARDIHGYCTDATGKYATCFCSLGALDRALDDERYSYMSSPALWILRDASGGDVVEFNDEHTHSEVMAMWDRAITLAKEEESEH